MSEEIYLPEGMLLSSGVNRELTSSLKGLEAARRSGRILEGRAMLCDGALGLTVELGDSRLRGYIPYSEAAYTTDGEPVRDIAILTRVGKAVCFKVIGLNTDSDGKICALLSRREAQRECAERLRERLLPGDIIGARVTHLEQFGAFVDIGCGIPSLLSVDCISVSRISHPRERFEPGEYIPVVVKSVDRESLRVTITHRELLGTWEENAASFSAGQTVAGIIRSVEKYGVFVELEPNLAGLAEPRDDVYAGQMCAVFIKSILPQKMKLKLVIVDAFRGEPLKRKPRYFIDTAECPRLDSWRYSPAGCSKIIETRFEPN